MNAALVNVAQRLGVDLLPDNEQWELRIQIRSESSSRLYIVARRKSSKQWACSCPGWKTGQRLGRGCKHLRAMSRQLEVLGEAAA